MLSGRVPARGEVIAHPDGAGIRGGRCRSAPDQAAARAAAREPGARRVRRLHDAPMAAPRPQPQASSRPGRAPRWQRWPWRSLRCCLVALGQAPFGSVVAGAAGLWRSSRWSRRRATLAAPALVGWAAGAAISRVALIWIVEPFLVDAARHGWMAPFALVLMAGGLGAVLGARPSRLGARTAAGARCVALGRAAGAWPSCARGYRAHRLSLGAARPCLDRHAGRPVGGLDRARTG